MLSNTWTLDILIIKIQKGSFDYTPIVIFSLLVFFIWGFILKTLGISNDFLIILITSPLFLLFFLKNRILKELDYLKEFNDYLKETIKQCDNIEKILEKNERIKHILKRLSIYIKLNPNFFVTQEISDNTILTPFRRGRKNQTIAPLFWKMYAEECFLILEILTDLRSDLTIRLAEQQKTLEWAKIEVSENIKWTTELTQVSELQKARLDKQIEQFEELQKVLVKV